MTDRKLGRAAQADEFLGLCPLENKFLETIPDDKMKCILQDLHCIV